MAIKMTRRLVLGGLAGSLASISMPSITNARVGPLENIVRLSSNENPYGPSKKALMAASQASSMGAYYPGKIAMELKKAIAEKNNLNMDQVALSSGSNEVLSAAVVAWGKEGKILSPDFTYDLHLRYAEGTGTEVVRLPLASDMSIDLDALENAIDDSISMVYVCNPNNPTGKTIDGNTLRDFCMRVGKKTTVIIDEAYNELTQNPEYSSMVDLVRENQNIIVTRTFSKLYGMAGMRVGYALGRSDLINIVGNHVMAWPNIVGLAAAHATYAEDDFIEFSLEKINQGREILNSTFKMHDIKPLPSETNFVFADIGRSVNKFEPKLRERNIQVHRAYPLYPNHLRVSLGKIEDLMKFRKIFSEVYTS